MKAAYKAGQKITIKELQLRAIKPDEIRIKVDACGICGTDLHVNPDEANNEALFGHEMAGRILEVGRAVGWLKVGQKVVIESATPCGKCDNCRNTRQELCSDIQSFFFLGYFGFSEETIVPAICAIPCDDLTPEVASISEPLGVAIDLVRLTDITINSNVLVMGQGPIGLMATALAKRAGARRVFVSEFGDKTARKKMAESLDIDGFIDPRKTPVAKYDFGCAIDRVLMTAPPPCLNDAFAVACKGGIISFIGIAHGEGAYCKFNVNDFHFKKLQLRASFASPALYTPMALNYLREGIVDGNSLISHRFGLKDIAKALDVAKNDSAALKIIINP